MTDAPPTAEHYDLLVVGAGINGAGIARDAAGRGMSVLLCDKDDIGAHTSSASTKLVHGGLRYLEHYEFGLVRHALHEREVLMQSAPHIIRPLRFVMPHDAGQRPAWLIRSGLLLYDHLARRRTLAASNRVNLRRHPAGVALRSAYRQGFEYSDGWVDDARLVVLCALDAAEKGATVLTHTRCVHARRQEGIWLARLQDAEGCLRTVRARALVNATGPWASRFLADVAGQDVPVHLRPIKGSHIVVPRLFDHDYAYIFQNPDKRIVFAIPYERDFTLIGTTDEDYAGEIDAVTISAPETDYLCNAVNRYFERGISPRDVVWSYAGVRPLLDEDTAAASEVSRDYRLQRDPGPGAPLLSVMGGKITTFRRLAQDAVGQLAMTLGIDAPHWTAHASLPGGDILGTPPRPMAVDGFAAWQRGLNDRYSWLAPQLVARYARAYGTRVHRLLHDRTSVAAMGNEIADGLYEAELEYLAQVEWAASAADVLWRRTKLGLHLPADAAAAIDDWFASRRAAGTSLTDTMPAAGRQGTLP